MTSRYGGAAEIGKAYDPYAPEQKRDLTKPATVAGGGTLAAIGGRQIVRSRNLETEVAERKAAHTLNLQNAATRKQRAEQKLNQVNNRKRRGVMNPRRYTRGQYRQQNPVDRFFSSGKRKSAERTAEAANNEYQIKAKMRDYHNKLSTPEMMAARKRNIMHGGIATTAVGAGIAALPFLAGRKDQGVSKTITQSRWGANAEVGRAWPEKDNSLDRKRKIVNTTTIGLGAAFIPAGIKAKKTAASIIRSKPSLIGGPNGAVSPRPTHTAKDTTKVKRLLRAHKVGVYGGAGLIGGGLVNIESQRGTAGKHKRKRVNALRAEMIARRPADHRPLTSTETDYLKHLSSRYLASTNRERYQASQNRGSFG